MKSKLASVVQILIFLLFLGTLCVLHFAIPDKSFSPQENRALQTLPKFSWSALRSGRYTSNLESYVSDQFPFRDSWTTLKAATELMACKDENNGVFLCPEDTLIEPWTAPETAILDEKLAAVNALADNAGIPVTFALIPSSAEIWGGLLPGGAPNDSQKAVIDYAYARVRAGTADLYSALAAHAAESIYYRTDHHWTTLGAYYGYVALAEAMGCAPAPLEEEAERVVTEEFYGTAWSASGFSWVAPDRISAYVDQGAAVITNYPAGEPVPGALYDESKLEAKDKYAYFYGGNTPLLTIQTGNTGPKLLILRDSYMDSLSPFLLTHFSEIHILDLRYYRAGLSAYLAEHDFDRILVCYSVKSFCEDGNVLSMAY